jgi:formate dehydrogenase assembly factor FdhD
MPVQLPPLLDYLVRPDPDDPNLSTIVAGVDQTGQSVETRVIHEKALTLYLNAQEIVTMMTIGDHPEELAVGYLLNQGMLKPTDEVTGIDVDEELGVVVVRTDTQTNFESKLKKRTQTSGCARIRSASCARCASRPRQGSTSTPSSRTPSRATVASSRAARSRGSSRRRCGCSAGARPSAASSSWWSMGCSRS